MDNRLIKVFDEKHSQNPYMEMFVLAYFKCNCSNKIKHEFSLYFKVADFVESKIGKCPRCGKLLKPDYYCDTIGYKVEDEKARIVYHDDRVIILKN